MAKTTMESMRTRFESVGWQYYAVLCLGVWLFISPWLLQFGISPFPTAPAAGAGGSVVYFDPQMVAQVFGLILVVLAATAIYDLPLAQEWSIPAFGLWVAFAPWILGFTGTRAAYAEWDFGAVGLLTCLAMVSRFFGTSPAQEPGESAVMPGQSPAHAGDKPSLRSPGDPSER